MFIETIKKQFGKNKPVFAEDIINMFPNYSRAYVFRLIKKAMDSKDLIKFSNGVYYIPSKTFFGISTITADSVIERKYVNWNDKIFGVYSGMSLLNMFSITTQVPNVVEIVTNNETTRCREIILDGRCFVLRKSRIEINNDNARAYMILQLFSDLGANERINSFAKQRIINYIIEKRITKSQLISLAMNFPARTSKNLMRSGILDDVA